jgi:hypothetical protein
MLFFSQLRRAFENKERKKTDNTLPISVASPGESDPFAASFGSFHRSVHGSSQPTAYVAVDVQLPPMNSGPILQDRPILRCLRLTSGALLVRYFIPDPIGECE